MNKANLTDSWAVAAWAVYPERHFVWTLLLFIAQAGWSAFTTVEKLSTKVACATPVAAAPLLAS